MIQNDGVESSDQSILTGFGGDSGRVTLRRMTVDDQDEFTELVRASADLYGPYMSLPATPQDFHAFLGKFADPLLAEGLVVCLRDTGAMAGNININSIIRGRAQTASLGYAAFAPTAGQGYMSEGLRLVMRYAFEELRLHRLEAQIQPGNDASLKLVQRHGFRSEGCSPELLFIDGAWRDHERWVITNAMAGMVPSEPHPTQPVR
ncbi:GNAT family N-acetyltransferase [Nonomuraea sp. NPDC050680]|uniref:GNAT family N-acetyltransferase n=1 Tax=Nonomuraea sp. NPDC050680 TaxID=3154630 RepID=UPI0033D390BD